MSQDATTRRAGRATWAPRLYRPGDERQILPLYPVAFQGLTRSARYWAWKFHDNPAGRLVVVAEEAGGRILGVLGGLPARVHAAGAEVTSSQVVEAMVHPDVRRGLRKANLFVTLLAALVDEAMGRRGAAFMFALPNQDSDGIHRTVGARFFDQVTRVVRPAGRRRLRLAPWAARGRVAVTRLAAFGAETDRLWAACRADFPLATIRDARYLSWRYRDCPLAEYHAFLAWDRRRDRPAGLAVLRVGWEGQPLAALVDWLVPRSDPRAAPALLDAVAGAARAAGARELAAWFPRDCPEQRWFLGEGFVAEPTAYPLVVRATHPEFPVERLARDWYYTMGDSDVF